MYKPNFLLLAVFSFFLGAGLLFYVKYNNPFYIYNFAFLGTIITAGILLYIKKHQHFRQIVQLIIGSYLLIILGLIKNNNIQIEGFLYYLGAGILAEAAVIHYLTAKIIGPLLFGRGFCGYACWSAMIFDLLPYKQPLKLVSSRFSYIRYAIFLMIAIVVAMILHYNIPITENFLILSFVFSNLIYYIAGVILAFLVKDNRAFCKYLCPVTVFLKPSSYFSLLRVKVDTSKCLQCQKCINTCPMQVDILDPRRTRKNGTECILCLKCLKTCPQDAVKII